MIQHLSVEKIVEMGWRNTGHTYGGDMIFRKDHRVWLYNPELDTGVILIMPEQAMPERVRKEYKESGER